MNVLFLADVFGAPGRRAVEDRLQGLREEHDVDFCVVNGENVADGAGIAAKHAARLLAAGADVITTGNHAFRQADSLGEFATNERLLRPANLDAPGVPGRGLAVHPARNGLDVAVVNLQGALFMTTPTSPFLVVDELIETARAATPIVVVDFHAEATSEKIALTHILAGKATAVIGTHTHVQTSDARVVAGGTAAITDAGMTGPHESVIGVETRLAVQRMRNGLPVRFRPADAGVRIEGVLVECTEAGRATRCTALRVALG